MKKYDYVHCAEQIFSDVRSVACRHEPYFCFTLLMDTHFPYWNGKKAYGSKVLWWMQDFKKLKEFQIRSIEIVDEELEKLITHLKNCEVIITSDHGDVIGEFGDIFGEQIRSFGHGIRTINPYVFRIPFVKGRISG